MSDGNSRTRYWQDLLGPDLTASLIAEAHEYARSLRVKEEVPDQFVVFDSSTYDRRKDGNHTLPVERQDIVTRLLRTPGYSVRRVAKEAAVSKGTVLRYRAMLSQIPDCPCGERAGHRGWCSSRFAHSARRQEFMKNWKKRQEHNANSLIVPLDCIHTVKIGLRVLYSSCRHCGNTDGETLVRAVFSQLFPDDWLDYPPKPEIAGQANEGGV